MNGILIACMIAGAVMLAGSMVIVRRNPRKSDAKYVIEDSKTLMGLMALSVFLGYWLLILRLQDPSLGGEGWQGLALCAFLGTLLLALAAYMILYCFVKKTYVYEDRIEVVTPFGRRRSEEWNNILTITPNGMTKGARFTFADDYSFTLSGANKNYKDVMNFAKVRLKGREGKALIKEIEKNMSSF